MTLGAESFRRVYSSRVISSRFAASTQLGLCEPVGLCDTGGRNGGQLTVAQDAECGGREVAGIVQHVECGFDGLYNRRFGLERLSQEFSRSVRSGEPLGVILFDIDHFKSVNDTYGHQVGDDVLKLISENAKGVPREGDTLMRYGGEEFVAVLPGAGEADLRTVGERMRRVVESSVAFESTSEVRVTISPGGVSFPSADVVDLDDLIRKADAALYSAKLAGRNRLILVEA